MRISNWASSAGELKSSWLALVCTLNQDEKYLDGVSPIADLNMTMKALGDLNPTS